MTTSSDGKRQNSTTTATLPSHLMQCISSICAHLRIPGPQICLVARSRNVQKDIAEYALFQTEMCNRQHRVESEADAVKSTPHAKL